MPLRFVRPPNDLARSLAIAFTGLLVACSGADDVGPETASPIADFIEGRVARADGTPEAGVWVIAQTASLLTPYRKIVVTDDDGRFVIPELPDATYQVWMRGYGLADSARVNAKRGGTVELMAEPAATPQQAAASYPASYWLSLIEPPDGSSAWVSQFKLGCQLCHQVGTVMTRNKTRELYDVGFRTAATMHATADGLGRAKLLDALATWSARINVGEVPKAPPRPQGIERSLVITQWAWGDGTTYAHGGIATDKRAPTANANGPVYGADIGNDRLLVLEPGLHLPREIKMPTRAGFETPWCNQTYRPLGAKGEPTPVGFGSLGCPAPGGTSSIPNGYDNPANPHSLMIDDEYKGRVWISTQIRREWGEDLPEFCKKDPVIANHHHHRQLAFFGPLTNAFELFDTCFGTQNLQIGTNGRVWTSGDSYVIGWFDRNKYDPDQPETLEAAQGWSPIVVDSDGDGVPDLPIVGFNDGIVLNSADGSVWTAQPGANPGDPFDYRGRLVRYDPGSDRHETFIPPAPGAGPRAVDVDALGVIWVALGGSGQLGKFERRKCKQTWGAGEQCSEGWTLYDSPGPVMTTTPNEAGGLSADFHYDLWVDQFDALGLGKDVVLLNGTGSDSLLAFDPRKESWIVIRIPYPLATFTRDLDGRIDDAGAGWKGRGLWFNNGIDPLLHSEIPQSYVGKVQLRPDPLAK